MSSVILFLQILNIYNNFPLSNIYIQLLKFFIMTETAVKNLPIRLGQYLKFINMVQDGHEAKLRISEGEVLVNGSIETRRGKQLNIGDQVTFDGKTFIITSTESK